MLTLHNQNSYVWGGVLTAPRSEAADTSVMKTASDISCSIGIDSGEVVNSGF